MSVGSPCQSPPRREPTKEDLCDLIEDRDETISQLRSALQTLVMMARTSGGTAGRDDSLCNACDAAERLLANR